MCFLTLKYHLEEISWTTEVVKSRFVKVNEETRTAPEVREGDAREHHDRGCEIKACVASFPSLEDRRWAKQFKTDRDNKNMS